ncbi:MAG: hypothetical protein ACOX7H_05805 [Bacillota bacterium]|jgi:hypothetical protein
MTDMSKKYWLFLRKGVICLTVLAIALFALIFWVQASPYWGWSIPFSVAQRGESLDPAITAAIKDDTLFGNISISVKDNVSVPKAYLLVNGKEMGDFSSGSLLIRVYDGDKLEIDVSNYKHDIYFYIDHLSTNIEEENLQAELLLNHQKGLLGIIHFK